MQNAIDQQALSTDKCGEILIVSTLAGVEYRLKPVCMSRIPSAVPEDWLTFQGVHVSGSTLSEVEQKHIQRFMKLHQTEALTNGDGFLTLAGGMLATCFPATFLPGDPEGTHPSLRQRGDDGFPLGADDVMREAYGSIPDARKFQHHRHYVYEMPVAVHGWQWSTTFGRWGALVTFADGWRGFTWPELLSVATGALSA